MDAVADAEGQEADGIATQAQRDFPKASLPAGRQGDREINPILRGWVNYFAIGHSSRCFSYIRDWVEKKIRRHLARAASVEGFGWKRWSREWLYGTLGLFHQYRVSYSRSSPAAASSLIGRITLDVNCAGARSAGNPHATCDVAGAGNGVTETPKRARRGKPWIQPRRLLRTTAPVLDPTTRV